MQITEYKEKDETEMRPVKHFKKVSTNYGMRSEHNN